MEWQLQDAKNQLSKVVQEARTKGPQVITLRGQRAAVIVSIEDFDKLQANRRTLVDHLLSGPSWDDEFVDLVNARDKSPGRDVDL